LPSLPWPSGVREREAAPGLPDLAKSAADFCPVRRYRGHAERSDSGAGDHVWRQFLLVLAIAITVAGMLLTWPR
jgi:hypothetical protein